MRTRQAGTAAPSRRAALLLLALLAPAASGCGGAPGKGQEAAQQPPGVAVCMGGANSGQPCPNGNLNGAECGADGLCVAAGTCIGGPSDGLPCPLGSECGSGVCPDVRLKADEVQAIMEAAARALDPSQYEVAVVVTDRRGVILGAGTNFPIDYRAACASTDCPGEGFAPGSDPFTVDTALQLARTAAFFSADQTPLTSRSVRFISGEHFPPGVGNTGAAALFGIENTNRGCSFDAVAEPLAASIPRADNLCSALAAADGLEPIPCRSGDGSGDQCGCTRGILTLPGAVPIYRIQGGGRMAGGIGVFIRGVVPEPDRVAAYPPGSGILRFEDDQSEFAIAEFAARAYAGGPVGLPNVEGPAVPRICANDNINRPACCSQEPQCDFNVLATREPPFDPVIFIDGIEVPEVANKPPVGSGAGTFGRCSGSLEPCRTNAPSCAEGETCAAIVEYIVPPNDLAQPVPQGWLISPGDSAPGVNPPLSAGEVLDIIDGGVVQAGRIRAGIRLPLATRTEMVLGVSDTSNALLGLFRMQDATVFSIDVAVAKSRNVTYFSSPGIDPLDAMDCPGPAEPPNTLGDCRGAAFRPGTAITNRTLSFGAQPFFPSGIEGNLGGFPFPFAPGPFRQTFIYDSNNPCTNGLEPRDGRQNGIVFFPGATPIYRNDELIGGFGVSGDGVEQDDIVTVAGARAGTGGQGFLPDARIRADRVFVRDVRLPFVKFNRRPEQ